METNTHRQLLKKPFILPEDVLVFPVTELAGHIRKNLDCRPDQFAITRPGMRTFSRIIDLDTAELLNEFRTPSTLVEGIIRYSRHRSFDPQQVLVQCFPVLQQFSEALLLVPADSPLAEQVKASFAEGQMVAGYEIRRVIQALEDTELYQVRDEKGRPIALKISRKNPSASTLEALVREAEVLSQLAGRCSPKLIHSGVYKEHYFVATDWISGVPINIRANELRNSSAKDWRKQLHDLCLHLLEAYTQLHAAGIAHGDIHDRNIMVDSEDRVYILDFGLAYSAHGETYLQHNRRAGIGLYMEPELAQALLQNEEAPSAGFAGEQYALASLCYTLISGTSIFESSPEKDIRYRQICQESPRPFATQGFAAWPEIEAVLGRALAKLPENRFASVANFLQALQQASPPKINLRSSHKTDGAIAEPDWLQDILQATSGTLLPNEKLFPLAPKSSVQYGAAGLAWFLYRQAQLKDDPKLLIAADLWSRKALEWINIPEAFNAKDVGVTEERVDPTSFYHRAAGVHCVQAHISHALGDLAGVNTQIEQFMAVASEKSTSPELAFGRSGILIGGALLYDIAAYSGRIDTTPLSNFLQIIAEEIWQEMDRQAALGDHCDLLHLGVAHGWAGILYAQLVVRQTLGLPLPGGFEERLQQLAAFAEPLGRGVSWIGTVQHPDQKTSTPAYSPGWCSGSAGYVYLWTQAHRVLGDKQYLQLAEKAGWHAYEHVDRHPHLCCGLSGRAFALLRLYRHTGKTEWLDRARQLAHFIDIRLQQHFSWEDRTLGLYWGSLGMALLTAELAAPERAVFPLFEPEGWSGR